MRPTMHADSALLAQAQLQPLGLAGRVLREPAQPAAGGGVA